MSFITIQDTDGAPVLINVDHVAIIMKGEGGNAVFVSSQGIPAESGTPFEQVKEKVCNILEEMLFGDDEDEEDDD